MNDTNIGRIFGGFRVEEMIGVNNSRHKLYRCKCMKCGNEIVTTMYNLEHHRVKTTCKVCGNDRTIVCSDNGITNTANNDDTEVISNTNKNNNMIVTPPTCDKSIDATITFTTYGDNSKNIENNKLLVQVGNGNLVEQEGPEYVEYRVNDNLSIFVRDKKCNLFDMPIYYFLAHCIPTDCSCHGAIAHTLDNYYDLETNLVGTTHFTGEVALYGNVFSLFPNSEKHERPTLDALDTCVSSLAFECADTGVQFLAMPHIGCGSNHLKWDDVRQMIIDNFIEMYGYVYNDVSNRNGANDENDALPNNIFITFCY